MDIQDRIEVFLRHLLQGRCANDAGVMDENVDPAIVVHRRLNDRASTFRRGYRRSSGDSFASGGSDLPRHLLRGTGVEAFAREAAPGVIDNDSCPPRREEQGIGVSQPSARAGDDSCTILESQLWQWMLLLNRCVERSAAL